MKDLKPQTTLNDGHKSYYDQLKDGSKFCSLFTNRDTYPLFPMNALKDDDNNIIELPGKSQWCALDNKSMYEKNCQELGKSWEFYNKFITYRGNANGYRADEWTEIDWQNSVWILGDSRIYGIGLDESDTIAYLLQEQLNRPVINMGLPGVGNDVIVYNLVSGLEKFGKPRGVIFNWSGLERSAIYSENGHDLLGPWVCIEPEKRPDYLPHNIYGLGEIFDVLYHNTCDYRMKSYIQSVIVRQLLSEIPYFSVTTMSDVAHYTRSILLKCAGKEKARDRSHHGKKFNQSYVEHLIAMGIDSWT